MPYDTNSYAKPRKESVYLLAIHTLCNLALPRKESVYVPAIHTLCNYNSWRLSGRHLLFEKAAQLVVLDNYVLETMGN